jgi:hypothetical protein
MEKPQKDSKWDATDHAAAGAGIGAAGVVQTAAVIGLSGFALLPVFVVLGALGGLAWWGVKKIAED